MKAFGISIVAATGLLLSACAEYKDHACTPWVDPEKADIVAAADWNKAVPVTIRIRQGEFIPSLLRLLEGRPYILTLVNSDDAKRMLIAEELFGEIALRELSGNPLAAGSKLSAIALDPNETRVLMFVPTLDGTYRIADGYPGIGGASCAFGWDAASGIGRDNFGVSGLVRVDRANQVR